MRKWYFILSACILVSVIIAFAYDKTGAKEAEPANSLYVSPNGNDQNEGTKEKPFRTLKTGKEKGCPRHNCHDSGRHVS